MPVIDLEKETTEEPDPEEDDPNDFKFRVCTGNVEK